jgi:hypothetical protein
MFTVTLNGKRILHAHTEKATRTHIPTPCPAEGFSQLSGPGGIWTSWRVLVPVTGEEVDVSIVRRDDTSKYVLALEAIPGGDYVVEDTSAGHGDERMGSTLRIDECVAPERQRVHRVGEERISLHISHLLHGSP